MVEAIVQPRIWSTGKDNNLANALVASPAIATSSEQTYRDLDDEPSDTTMPGTLHLGPVRIGGKKDRELAAMIG